LLETIARRPAKPDNIEIAGKQLTITTAPLKSTLTGQDEVMSTVREQVEDGIGPRLRHVAATVAAENGATAH